MKVTRYFCDKCKKEVEKSDDLKIANLGFDCYYTCSWGTQSFVNSSKLELCEPCSLKLGLIKSIGERVHNEPTIKDKLYDVFCELVKELIPNSGA